MTEQTAFKLSIDEQNIAWLSIDVVGEKMNTLQAAFAQEMEAIFLLLFTFTISFLENIARQSCAQLRFTGQRSPIIAPPIFPTLADYTFGNKGFSEKILNTDSFENGSCTSIFFYENRV